MTTPLEILILALLALSIPYAVIAVTVIIFALLSIVAEPGDWKEDGL